MSWSAISRVEVPDGAFDAKVVLPAITPAPGLLVLQEIFGVNSYIEDVCHRLADMGYVAMAPDVFWRFRPGIVLEGRSEEVIAEAFGYGKRLDVPQAVADLRAALTHLRALPEVSTRVGVIGFCLGGTLAFLLAAEADPDVCISYYGAGVPGMIDRLDDVACPVLFHFGGDDPVISGARVAKVQAAAEGRPRVEVQVFPGAGHAFDNHRDQQGFAAEASSRAWLANETLLRATLPV